MAAYPSGFDRQQQADYAAYIIGQADATERSLIGDYGVKIGSLALIEDGRLNEALPNLRAETHAGFATLPHKATSGTAGARFY